ncbi:MAG: AI-2E family transporter [Actinomycetota bacterium]
MATTQDKPHQGRLWEVPLWLDRLTGWSWRLAVVGIAAFVLLRLFWILRLVTIPILFSLVLTALLWPMRRFLANRGAPPVVASALVMLLAGAVVGGVIWLASAGIGRQLADGDVWAETRDAVENWLMDGPLGLTATEIDEYEDRLTTAITSGAATVGMDRARLVVEIIGATILTAVLLFFFLKDGPQMWRFASGRLQNGRRQVVDRAGEAAFGALSGYARGVAITGLFDGVAVGLVLVVLGVPLALPLALLTALGAFIPIVGATAVGGLSTVVALVTVGPRAAIILAVATLIIQQVEGDLILPLAMGSQVRLHPSVVLIALAIGGATAGILGAFVAVPIAAMASAATREFQRASRHPASLATSSAPPSATPGRR